MQKATLILCLFIVFLSNSFVVAQNNNKQTVKETLKLANQYSEQKNTEEEINCYKKLYVIDSTNTTYIQKLGSLAFDGQENYSDAIFYFEKLIKIQKDTNQVAAELLALAYHHSSNYQKAFLFYTKFNKLTNPGNYQELKNVQIEKGILDCYFALKNLAVSDSYEITNMGANVNSKFDDSSPRVNLKDSSLYFTSRKPLDINSPKEISENKYFENIYKSNLYSEKSAAPINFDGNKQSLTSNKNKSIITFSNSFDSLFVGMERKIYKLKLDEAGNWINPEIKNFLSKDNITYFSFADSSKVICFAIQKIKEFGTADIYYQTKNRNGTFSEIKKFSSEVNTEFEEKNPFVSKDGNTIYFASNGLNGFGGYDLYKLTFKNGKWGAPQNLGLPINSSANEMNYSENPETGEAYISSDRAGGYGLLDIYKIEPTNKKASTFDPKSFEFTFDISKSIDTIGQPLNYEWNFDDGTIGYGPKIIHQFNQPKAYKVVLNGTDTTNKIIENGLAEILVDLSNETYLSIDCEEQEIVKLKNIELDADRCSVKDSKILQVDWKLHNNQRIKNKTKVTVMYDNEGEYYEQIIVKAQSNLSGKINYYSFTKKIIVHEK
jgi:tetratricopeptide (TPR) repeat protein